MPNASVFTIRADETPPYRAPLDPLGADLVTDTFRSITHRQLGRLLLIATEVGARYQREGISQDPLAWMYATRRLFRGLAAIDAVIDLENCERAVILHGLGLGLDADPELIDDLRHDDVDDIREAFELTSSRATH